MGSLWESLVCNVYWVNTVNTALTPLPERCTHRSAHDPPRHAKGVLPARQGAFSTHPGSDERIRFGGTFTNSFLAPLKKIKVFICAF